MGRHREYKIRDYAVGQQLLMLRTRAGLTQDKLAELLGMHRRSIQNWEVGAAYPNELGLQRLLALYVEHAVFTPGQESHEAEALWQQVSLDSSRSIAPFDAAWFAGLLALFAADASEAAGERSAARSAHTLTTPRPNMRRPRAPHNLPATLTAFVGRADELAATVALLGEPDCRLITIVGIGGIGKTRLALHVARMVLDEHADSLFPDGVYVVSLADVAPASETGLHSSDAAATAIADALSFTLSGSERPLSQISHYLRDQRMLLVLDNIEHLLDLAPALVALLQQAPALKILSTSRARLNVRGEQIVPLDGLPYPPLDGAAPAELILYPAIELFQRTAATHAPQFDWSADDLAQVAAICAHVAGMPLAIELAASLTRLLSLADIAAELATGNTVLHASQRDLAPRHHSLQAVFDHSWRLLAPRDQRILSDLSVFRGGFDRHAARVVAGADLQSLATLLDHSLLREGSPPTRATRYSLHDLLRHYAEAKRHARPAAEQVAVQNRHSEYYLRWVAERLPDVRGEGQQAAQAEIHREIENIRLAWRTAVAHGDFGALVQAGDALFHFYEMRSWFGEGAELFQLAAERCAQLAEQTRERAATLALAQLLARQGWLTFHLGQQHTAKALLEHSRALLEPLDAPVDQAFTLNYLAAVTYHMGDYAGAQLLAHQALDRSVRSGYHHGTVIAKTILGQIAYLVGAYADAQRWSLESLALEQSLGNRWGSVFTLISLGRVAIALQAYADARHWFEHGLAIREASGDIRGMGLCLAYLGDVEMALQQYPEAEQHYQASLARFRLIGNAVGVAAALTKLAAVALATADPRRAQHLARMGLQTAWAVRALPQTLDALAGLAAALAGDDPAQAAEIAAVVAAHPAATQSSKGQAQQLARPESIESALLLPDAERALERWVLHQLAYVRGPC
jgi:predicted ATPase/transcriptional regulator with XRE-family HTH domain